MAILTVGGIPVSDTGVAGDLVVEPGQVQYGGMLLGVGSAAGWAELVGWRDLPDTTTTDTSRPQAHGSYPGDVWAESAMVDYTCRLAGPPKTLPAERAAAIRVLEAGLRVDGIDRPLVVNDGVDVTMRMGRVLKRRIPQPWDFTYARALDGPIQFLCADPRRYSVTQVSATVALGTSTGGLVYPLAYPLAYGATSGGSRSVTNDGNTPAPFQAVLAGPLTNPVLVGSTGWRLGFRIVLAAGETLTVDTAAGTALLNGDTDRLYTIDAISSPLERCLLPAGTSTVSLAASAGTGQAAVTYRHTYL